jgi:hypothetical protein
VGKRGFSRHAAAPARRAHAQLLPTCTDHAGDDIDGGHQSFCTVADRAVRDGLLHRLPADQEEKSRTDAGEGMTRLRLRGKGQSCRTPSPRPLARGASTRGRARSAARAPRTECWPVPKDRPGKCRSARECGSRHVDGVQTRASSFHRLARSVPRLRGRSRRPGGWTGRGRSVVSARASGQPAVDGAAR